MTPSPPELPPGLDPRRSGPSTRAGRAARASARAARATVRGTASAAAGTAHRVRRATSSQGAGESGLGRLTELHGVAIGADALVTVGLAGTLFFAVPVGEARGRVALYLLVTMAPFVLVAPVIGPLLDRLRHGRRYALATTCWVRALLAWIMSAAVAGETEDALRLYPAAFGLLVMSKAYHVTRSAMVPRVLPAQISLVKANSRISMAGLITAAVAAPVGAGLAWFGPAWTLRLAVIAYVAGGVLCVLLPREADSAAGEEPARISGEPEPDARPRLRNVGPAVVASLRANAALRAFAGFLTLFLAFLLRAHPLGDLSAGLVIGLAAVGAALGSFVGTSLGALRTSRAPEAITVVVLVVATAACALGAGFYALWTIILVAAGAGFSQSLGKLALDALIQREVPERWRTSAFARSETALALAWVLGGGIGIVVPLSGRWGLGVAAVLLLAMLVATLLAQRRARVYSSRSSATARSTAPTFWPTDRSG
ncbi:MAG TPA: MFS transporter [Actinomycetes bacterium]|nr:MFS transporter [Actinomycetes bacterium]